jgi:hypothetical protein
MTGVVVWVVAVVAPLHLKKREWKGWNGRTKRKGRTGVVMNSKGGDEDGGNGDGVDVLG